MQLYHKIQYFNINFWYLSAKKEAVQKVHYWFKNLETKVHANTHAI